MGSILFVCLGNICRSPLAKGIAQYIFEKKGLHVKVDSAGTGSWHVGEPPCLHSIKIAKTHNIDISHLRARKVRHSDAQLFDYIIAMDDSNLENLKTLGIIDTIKLGDFGYEGADVPDPYHYKDEQGFEKVYKMLYTCISNFIDLKY
jgi:protein-tyrosine phosphatase